jgi:hypothetical protein
VNRCIVSAIALSGKPCVYINLPLLSLGNIKLLVVCDSVPQRYQTIYDLTKDDFKKLSAPRLNADLQKVRDNLKDR